MDRQTYVEAYFALMEAGELLRYHVERQLRTDADLSYVQFRILALLSEAPGMSARMTDLADAVVYSRSGTTYQARQLEQVGLITRQQSPEDERATVVTITDAGQERLGRALPGHLELVERELFGPLSETDVLAMKDVLTRIRDQLRASPPRSILRGANQPAQPAPASGRD